MAVATGKTGVAFYLLLRPEAIEMHIARKYTLVAQRVLIDHVYHRALGLTRPIIRRQPKGVNTVALTFDDGPSPKTTPFILRELERAGARATFFLSGVRVAAHPDLAAAIVKAGHAVYGHGWEHVSVEDIGPEAAVADARRVESLLDTLRPTPSPYLVRFPYNAGCQRGWLHRAIPEFHPDVRFASWDFSTQDWMLAEGCGDLGALTRKCAAMADTIGARDDLPGSILLMHEDPFNAPGHLSSSVATILLPMVLARIAARGLRGDSVRTEPARSAP